MFSFTARPFMRGLAFVVVLSGCADGSPSAPAPSSFATPSQLAGPAAHLYGNDFMYSSQPSGNQVAVYKRKDNGTTLKSYETLTYGVSTPMGMVATPAGRLYVANSGDSNVLVYRTKRTGPQGPEATLHDDGEVPVNVDVTSNGRVVAVSNGSTTGDGAGSVSVYLNRQDEPSRTLTYGSDPIEGAGIAIDSNGNCYWSFNDPTTLTGSIVEFARCKGRATPIVSGILKAGGLAFDENQNLYYVDQLAGIYQCNGLSGCTLMTAIGCSGCLVRPANINFDNSNPQNLWVADAAGYIDAVSLTGTIEYTLDVVGGPTDPPFGIAPAPGS
jgi:DNA-binding beta-propeller fold protein YncE